MEQAEPIESPILWQELTPKEAAYAVLVGYGHLVNNSLMPLEYVHFYDLDSEQLKKHDSLKESFCVKPESLNLERIPFDFNQKSAEQAVRLAAQWLKEKIEEKIRKNLGLPHEEESPTQVWFRQAKEFYSFDEFSDKERKAIENSFNFAMTAWENLEALADPKREIKPGIKLEDYPTSGKIFDFREQLTLPR